MNRGTRTTNPIVQHGTRPWTGPSRRTRLPNRATLVVEVLMTTSSDHADHIPARPAGRISLDELARRKGVRPVASMDDLACDVFDTDDELDDFLRSTYAARRADLG